PPPPISLAILPPIPPSTSPAPMTAAASPNCVARSPNWRRTATEARFAPAMSDDAKAAIDPHSKAATLAAALPYLRRYAGRTVVVKYGGHAMGEEQLGKLFAADIVLLKQVGLNPIVVHGGGPQIGAMLERLKIKSSFTDRATVEIVEMVLSGAINKEIAAAINAAGGRAIGLSGKDANLIRARQLKRTKKDPDSNIEKLLDLGFVGEPYAVDAKVLETLIQSDVIPVIAPIGVGDNGETFNINADTAADAVLGGVEAAFIIDGRVPHAILLELFAEGAGTLIRRRSRGKKD